LGMQMRKRLSKLAVFAILMFIVVCTFFPYYFMLISSLKNNSEIAAHPFTMTLPLRFENYTSSYRMILQYLALYANEVTSHRQVSRLQVNPDAGRFQRSPPLVHTR